jgi:hypothetical protein
MSKAKVIKLDSRRRSPWNLDAGCPCAACYVRQMGKDLDERLRVTEDLMSLAAADAMRHYLDQLGELCGVQCQYAPSEAR